MQIALHVGAHCTDEDRIFKCLRKNTDKLGEEGIVVPLPGRYRPVLKQTLHHLKDDIASPEMQEVILDALLDEDDASRVVLSHDGFLGVAEKAMGDNTLYPLVGKRGPRIRNLFAQQDVEFFIALRDPATFIPAVFAKAQETDFAAFMEGVDPMRLRWSEMILRLRQAVPEAPVTVWCNEDSPIIWPEILREITGHDQFTILDGVNDFLAELMSRGGVKRMRAYLEAHPPQNELQRRRIVSAFLDKFALDEAIEEEIDLPGWTASYIEQLSNLYYEDVENIHKIPGVTFIAP